jgi:hypothetical protein
MTREEHDRAHQILTGRTTLRMTATDRGPGLPCTRATPAIEGHDHRDLNSHS